MQQTLARREAVTGALRKMQQDAVAGLAEMLRDQDARARSTVAYVVGEADRGELDALCLKSIARFKRPKDYVFVNSLPKNNYGKVLKTELRERDAARDAAAHMPP